eukprot:2686413-Prymnesium_polylepis.1
MLSHEASYASAAQRSRVDSPPALPSLERFCAPAWGAHLGAPQRTRVAADTPEAGTSPEASPERRFEGRGWFLDPKAATHKKP